MGPPVIDVYERCLLGVFQATVCACSVERVCSRAVYLSYLSISIHTRSVVARDPRPDLYRGVGDASQILILLKRISKGKGLTKPLSRRGRGRPGANQGPS